MWFLAPSSAFCCLRACMNTLYGARGSPCWVFPLADALVAHWGALSQPHLTCVFPRGPPWVPESGVGSRLCSSLATCVKLVPSLVPDAPSTAEAFWVFPGNSALGIATSFQLVTGSASRFPLDALVAGHMLTNSLDVLMLRKGAVSFLAMGRASGSSSGTPACSQHCLCLWAPFNPMASGPTSGAPSSCVVPAGSTTDRPLGHQHHNN